MKANHGALLRRSLVAATLSWALLSTSVATVGATTLHPKINAKTALANCGVVATRAIHFVADSSPCVIRVAIGTNVQIKFRSGFRWGYPVSNSRSVIVSVITRSSIGVTAATLHAASKGHALIRATGTVYCKPGVACPDLALLWSLKVVVT
jgi:hypothetical protein